MRNVLILALVATPSLVVADVIVDWVEPAAGATVAVDAFDNVYTAHYEYDPAGDIVITKRSAGGTLLWETRYDQIEPSKWERASWLEVDGQGDVVIAGTLMSGYSNPVEAASILMKFSPEGELLWRQVHESSFDGSYTKKCLVDGDDFIYVLGMGSGPSGYVTKVKKFDPEGGPVWTYFDAAGIGAPINLNFTPDGGLVITGRSIFGSINGYAKVDVDGNALWSHTGVQSLTIGDAAGDSVGNSYLVHGEWTANPGTVVRKLTPAGALEWANVYDLSGFRVVVGSDDRPVVCGFPDANTPGASFVKIAQDGQIVWANPDADGPLGLLLHALLRIDGQDNVYLAAGTLTEMAICKVSSQGASEWTALMPGGYAQSFVLGLQDNVYVVGGTTAKLVQEPAVSVPGADGSVAVRMRSFPNPTGGDTTLRFEVSDATPVTVRIFDAAGRNVGELLAGWRNAGSHEIRFDASRLPAGVYLAELRHGGIVETQRLTVVGSH